MLGSIGRYFVRLRCHRPLRAEAVPQSDHRYQIPGGAGFEEIRQQAGDGLGLLGSVGETVVEVDAAAVALTASVPAPLHACVDKFHRVEGYSGYTWIHLPVRKESAPLFSAADATFASLAARMARSSF